MELDKTSTDFWSQFSQIPPGPNSEHLVIDSVSIRVKGIDFPHIQPEIIFNQFLKLQGVNPSTGRKRLTFESCTFESFRLEVGDVVAAVEFSDCIFEGSVEIETLLDSKCTKTDFNGSVKLIGKNPETSQIKLNECQFDDDVTFEHFNFSAVIQEGHVKRTERASIFNNLWFRKKLTLKNVTFSKDIVFNSVRWPKKIRADRDIFRQLKNCMEEQKNSLQANVFHSLEMNEYRKELFSDNWFNFSKLSDKLIFLLNWGISDFTQSWARPLFLIFVISAIFFVWACGVDAFSDCGWNAYFHFMNPFNRTTEHYNSVYAIWFLHKVLIALLSYHLIVALRKKTKY